MSYHDFFYFQNGSLLTLNRALDIERAIRTCSTDFQCCPGFLFYVVQNLMVSSNSTHTSLGYEVQLFPWALIKAVFSLNEYQQKSRKIWIKLGKNGIRGREIGRRREREKEWRERGSAKEESKEGREERTKRGSKQAKKKRREEQLQKKEVISLVRTVAGTGTKLEQGMDFWKVPLKSCWWSFSRLNIVLLFLLCILGRLWCLTL